MARAVAEGHARRFTAIIKHFRLSSFEADTLGIPQVQTLVLRLLNSICVEIVSTR